MGLGFYIAYLAIGFVQLFAIAAGLNHLFGGDGITFLSMVGALFLTYIPFVGAGFGVYGAVVAWGWAWWWAVALWFWFVPVSIVLASLDK